MPHSIICLSESSNYMPCIICTSKSSLPLYFFIARFPRMIDCRQQNTMWMRLSVLSDCLGNFSLKVKCGPPTMSNLSNSVSTARRFHNTYNTYNVCKAHHFMRPVSRLFLLAKKHAKYRFQIGSCLASKDMDLPWFNLTGHVQLF